jgi:hypothetical protein
MVTSWPALPYEPWRPTLDTLHAHSQVLGKLALSLAPPEPEWQHAALRLTARGLETQPLPAPDDSGVVVVALDLHTHEVVAEHSDGRVERVALTPHRPVAEVTRAVLAAMRTLVGPVEIDPRPSETPWTTPLDEDTEHATYEPEAVSRFLAAATYAALVLAALRAPFRGRSTPVNAWWGSFDLAVGLFSGRSADPPSDGLIARNAADAQQIAVGWWPGNERYPRAAFYGYAYPAAAGLPAARLPHGRWEPALGEYVLDWDDARAAPDPERAALEFAHAVVLHACAVCEWDSGLAATVAGEPPPIR